MKQRCASVSSREYVYLPERGDKCVVSGVATCRFGYPHVVMVARYPLQLRPEIARYNSGHSLSTLMAAQIPSVSVIVPAYKVTEYIGDTLESLRAQTFRDFEIVVVNDGCPDTVNLERTLEPYRNEIVYLRHEKNSGLASARNTAIRAARAPVVALLDSDDIWEPEYLAEQVTVMKSRPDVDVVYPNATLFGESQPPGIKFMDVFPSRGAVSFRSLVARECYVFIGATIRRDSLLRVGLFDADLRSAEDFDLWLRLARSGARFHYHTRPLVRYRVRNSSLSSDPLWMIDNVLKVYNRLLAAPDLTPEDREALESGIRHERVQEDLFLGKKALYAGNRSEAAEKLGRANRVLKRRKIQVALLVLRLAPNLLYRFIQRRYPTEYSFLH